MNMLIVKKDYFIKYLIYFGINVFFWLSAYLNIPFFSIFGVILMFGYGVFGKINETIMLMFFLIPNQAIICIPNTSVGLLGLYSIVIFLKIINEDRGCLIDLFQKKKFICPAIFLILLNGFNFFRHGSLYDIAILIQMLIVVMTFLNWNKKGDLDIFQSMIDMFVLGCLILFINGCIYGLLTNEWMQINTTNRSMVLRFKGINDDSNYCGISFAFCSLIFFIKYTINMKWKNLFWGVFFFALCMFTGSRGALLALIVGMIWYIVSSHKLKFKHLLIFFSITFVFFMCVLFVPISFFESIRVSFVERTLAGIINSSGGDFSDISSGRFYLWKLYWQYFIKSIKSILIGFGLYNYGERIAGTLCAHNVLISSLVTEGILGTISIIMIYSQLFISSIQMKKMKMYVFSLLLVAIVGYMFLDGILDIRLSFYILIAGYSNLIIGSKDKMKVESK